MHMRQHKLPILALAAVILLWGSTYPAIKLALNDYTPLDLATLRFIFAALSLVLIACVKGIRLPPLKDLPRFILLALLGFISYQLLLNYGELHASAGVSGFMISLTPIFILFLSAFLFHERITLLKVIGTIIALSGVWLICENPHAHASSSFGILLLALASLSLSLFFTLQKKLTKHYSSFETTCYAVWIATILFIAINTPQATIRSVILHHGQGLWLSFYMGCLCTSVAYWLWAYCARELEVSKASIGTYMVPFVSAFIAHITLGEAYSVNFILGGVLIVIGVLIATILKYTHFSFTSKCIDKTT